MEAEWLHRENHLAHRQSVALLVRDVVDARFELPIRYESQSSSLESNELFFVSPGSGIMSETEHRTKLYHSAERLAEVLAEKNIKMVAAESCTSGMIGAAMGTVPGISNYFCGTVVTYRLPSKTAWLDVKPATLAEHTAESQPTSDEMAGNVLDRTPEADWSVAITGHFGPDVENEFDGICYLSIAKRGIGVVAGQKTKLQAATRKERQIESARLAIEFLTAEILR